MPELIITVAGGRVASVHTVGADGTKKHQAFTVRDYDIDNFDFKPGELDIDENGAEFYKYKR